MVLNQLLYIIPFPRWHLQLHVSFRHIVRTSIVDACASATADVFNAMPLDAATPPLPTRSPPLGSLATLPHHGGDARRRR